MTDPKLTPPPELVRAWQREANHNEAMFPQVAAFAAQWGADIELEACIDWMKRMGYWGDDGKAIPALRAARRPKPPSLKYQALKSLGHINRGIDRPEDTDIIRRALEQLDD
jgi:hypothetical protein